MIFEKKNLWENITDFIGPYNCSHVKIYGIAYGIGISQQGCL